MHARKRTTMSGVLVDIMENPTDISDRYINLVIIGLVVATTV